MSTEPPSPPTFFDEEPAPPALNQPNNVEPAVSTAAVPLPGDAESAVRPTQQPKSLLARLDLDTAIRLRWVLRDIKAKRTKFMPVNADDLRTLIEMGLIEMRDEVPVLTNEGERALDWS